MNLSDLFTGGSTTLASLLWPMATGLILAVCAVFWNKQTIGKFVKKLFDMQATSEDNAKSLAEIGYGKSRMIPFLLRHDATLRKVIYAVPAGEQNGNQPERYYIPESCAYRAERMYNPDGTSLLTITIAIILFIALAMILLAVIPDLLQMAANALDAFKSHTIA